MLNAAKKRLSDPERYTVGLERGLFERKRELLSTRGTPASLDDRR